MLKALTICLLAAFPAFGQARYGHDGPAVLPDAKYSPGAIRTQNKAILCPHADTKAVRHVTTAEKKAACREYGIPAAKCNGRNYEIDHALPLEDGGSNLLSNLWPQPIEQARIKDVLENAVHGKICNGKMTVQQALSCLAGDWARCYVKIYGKSPELGTNHGNLPSQGSHVDSAPHHISSMGNGLKMIGVDAQRIPTKVVQYESRGDFAPVYVPEKDVRSHIKSFAVDRESSPSIASRLHGFALPYPTPGNCILIHPCEYGFAYGPHEPCAKPGSVTSPGTVHVSGCQRLELFSTRCAVSLRQPSMIMAEKASLGAVNLVGVTRPEFFAASSTDFFRAPSGVVRTGRGTELSWVATPRPKSALAMKANSVFDHINHSITPSYICQLNGDEKQ